MKRFFCKIKCSCAAFDFGGADFFAVIAASFLLSSLIFACGGDFSNLAYVRSGSVLVSALICALSAAVIFSVTLLTKSKAFLKIFLMSAATALCAVLCVSESENIWFDLGLATALVFVAKYVFFSPPHSLLSDRIKLSAKGSLWVTAAIFLLFFAYISFCTVAKYAAFRHSTFDFGIFCQMFEQMAKTGAPLTTVERSKVLSHFAVHFSPVYYLLLPGYMIFRSPVYLLLAQAAVVGAGVFPVRRICRALGLGDNFAAAAALLYAIFPTMANGCFYDFHENKLLAVFLLYMVAFVLEGKVPVVCISAVAVLSVKEDAFIYVLAVCLWMIASKRCRKTAVILAAASVLYFFFACAVIRLCGGEIMSSRFGNFSSGGNGGLADAVRTCFLDIGYLIREVFSGADTEAFREVTYGGQKLEFVLWTVVPLLFAPFLRRRTSSLLLLLPLLVVNLMPSWVYQSNIDYQYTYGTAALMIASALMFFAEIPQKHRRGILCTMLIISFVFSVSAQSSKASRAIGGYFSDREAYSETAAVLREEIKEGSTVTAYGYMMPHLYYIDDMHTCPEYYDEYKKTDYYVIDTRYKTDAHTEKMFNAMGGDYELCASAGYAEIYKLKK